VDQDLAADALRCTDELKAALQRLTYKAITGPPVGAGGTAQRGRGQVITCEIEPAVEHVLDGDVGRADRPGGHVVHELSEGSLGIAFGASDGSAPSLPLDLALCRAPPGIRTQNLRIKSPLLCH
jgi:hypothetical protein